MNSELKFRLKELRPSLYTIAPLTFCICWGYAVINLGLGAGMYSLYRPETPIAVANIFTYQVWGIIFILIGLLSVIALIKNSWKTTRILLLWGLTAKAVWAIALVVRCFIDSRTILITLVWLFFAYIQAITYIFFIPKINGNKNNGSTG